MGAYVSIPDCKSHYNETVNCEYNVKVNESNPFATIGGHRRGEIPADPDIAGIGVVSSFLATTSFALLLSITSVVWSIGKRCWGRDYHDDVKTKTKKLKRKRQFNFHLSEFCEELVLSCTDTQIFTGGAYAITLRYYKGCSITAYHYDIVANLMLLTCATHLMSVTIVRNYWKYPWLGLVRVALCTGVFIVTGILLANQNSTDLVKFPSYTPPRNETEDMILMPAACFQQGDSQLPATLASSLSDKAKEAILFSAPNNKIPGWNNYLIILLLYVIAGFVDVLRFFHRGARSKPNGRRARVVNFLKRCLRPSSSSKINAQQHRQQQIEKEKKTPFVTLSGIVFFLFSMYLLGGVGVSSWTVAQSALYIRDLRAWAKQSGWLKLGDGGQSAEDDATSFGQAIPIFLNLLLIMTVAQLMSQACWSFSERKFDIYGGVIHEPRSSSGQGDDDDDDTPPGSGSKSNGVAVQVVPSPYYYYAPVAGSQQQQQGASAGVGASSNNIMVYSPPMPPSNTTVNNNNSGIWSPSPAAAQPGGQQPAVMMVAASSTGTGTATGTGLQQSPSPLSSTTAGWDHNNSVYYQGVSVAIPSPNYSPNSHTTGTTTSQYGTASPTNQSATPIIIDGYFPPAGFQQQNTTTTSTSTPGQTPLLGTGGGYGN